MRESYFIQNKFCIFVKKRDDNKREFKKEDL